MRTFMLLVVVAIVSLWGCSAGDTPTETYKLDTPKQTDSTGGAIEANPNLPPAAKDALLGGKK